MGDRTKIADALQRMAESHRNEAAVWEQRSEPDMVAFNESRAELLDDAARLLRADPDTSDERWHRASPDEVLTYVEELLRDTDWSSQAEDRCRVALLHIDAYRAGKAKAPNVRLIEAERDADVSAGAVARTVAMSHIAAERDAERAARERAEAEARQLREAIEFTASALDFEIDGDTFPRGARDSLLGQLAVIDASVAEGAEE